MYKWYYTTRKILHKKFVNLEILLLLISAIPFTHFICSVSVEGVLTCGKSRVAKGNDDKFFTI